MSTIAPYIYVLGLTHTSTGSTNGHYNRVVGVLLTCERVTAQLAGELVGVARGQRPWKRSAKCNLTWRFISSSVLGFTNVLSLICLGLCYSS